MTFGEVCKALSISEATGRNWVRLGKLTPKKDGSFDKEKIDQLIEDIKLGKAPLLKSRRNKKKKIGNAVYSGYIESSENVALVSGIVKLFPDNFDEKLLRLIVANCSMQLFLQKTGEKIENWNLIKSFCAGKIDLGVFAPLVRDVLQGCDIKDYENDAIAHILEKKMIYFPGEDVLGLLYISLRDFAERKSKGAYYTPFKIVNELVDALERTTNICDKRIFDPCCGTGNFLIHICSKVNDPRQIYAQDLDLLSVQIARINVALMAQIENIDFLYKNILCADSLDAVLAEKFDIIIGNPPWGFEFDDDKVAYLKRSYRSARGKSFESYDLFIEQAVSLLSKNGILSFVLPEAFLNVSSHKEIRKLIMELCSFRYVSYLDEAFDKVNCPSIILGLQLSDSPGKVVGCEVVKKTGRFTIEIPRNISYKEFSLHISDEQHSCIEKIESLPNRTYLQEHSSFALGIVTGDNKKYLKQEYARDYEPILKGQDIFKYKIAESKNYIKFSPELYQQVAKTELYRAKEKLFYRFICDTLVFAYDNQQRLSLNSCNVLIPEIPGLEIKYILAILNSRAANFYYSMRFKSTKVLRSQLEQIPIPLVEIETQKSIIEKVDALLKSKLQPMKLYEELDIQIMKLYGLNHKEISLIKQTFSDKYF